MHHEKFDDETFPSDLRHLQHQEQGVLSSDGADDIGLKALGS